ESSLRSYLSAFLLAQHRDQARDLAASCPDLERIVELAHGVPEPKVEQLLAQLGQAQPDLVRGHLPHRSRLGLGHVTLLPTRAAPRNVSGSAAWKRRASAPPARASG